MIMRNQQTEAGTLRDATYATLEGSAVTPAAMRLVSKLNDRVVARASKYERQHNTPKTNRGKLKRAVEAFLADLLTVHAVRPKAGGWVYRSLKTQRFKGTVGYRVFLPVHQALTDTGLVEHRPGVGHWTRSFDDEAPAASKTVLASRWASRFRATPDLLKLCASQGVPASKALDHFSYGLPQHPLQKRAASTKDAYSNKLRGAVMKFTHTLASQRIEDEVRALNEFLDKQSIKGGVHRGYVRAFNNGDAPNFEWNQGGRLYSQPSGDANYQQLNGKQRRKMTINGEPVAEVDIRASFLTIFHAWHGQQLDPKEDPYALPGLGGKAGRDAVKLWAVAAFGKERALVRWPSELVEGYNAKNPKAPLDSKRYTVRGIREHMITKYPLLATWGEPQAGRVRTWADLQYDESVIINATMLRLMREHQIPTLAVHDSLVVQSKHAELTAEKLKENFKAHLGTEPLIKINLSCTRFRRHRVRCFMEQEVRHGEKAVYAGVQA
jgi:hypothetical protein